MKKNILKLGLFVILSPLTIFSQTTQIQVTQGTSEGPSLNLCNTLKTSSDQSFNWRIYNMTGPYGNTLQFWPYNSYGQYLNSGSAFTISDYGNIGIGIGTNDLPQYKLDVNGKLNLRTVETIGGWMRSYLHWNAHSLVMGTPAGVNAYNSLDLEPGGYNSSMPTPLSSQLRMYTANSQTDHQLMIQLNSMGNCYFNNTGNVGIKCENPKYNLDVKGTIHALEVLVDNDFWCDFVFEKNYKLPSLEHVENYIQTNGHLQNLPSTKEVKEKGQNIAEIQIKLLQKIEELTLYIIEQNKKIEYLQTQIKK